MTANSPIFCTDERRRASPVRARHPVPAPWRPNGISSDFFSPAVTFGSPWRATQIPTPEFRRTIAARRETDITPWHDHMSADRRKPADRRPMRSRTTRTTPERPDESRAGRRARARAEALAGRLRARPRQHRRGLRGSRIPRRQPVAAEAIKFAGERGAPGPDLQPHAAIRAPDHRRHAARSGRHQGGAGRLRRATGRSRASAPA